MGKYDEFNLDVSYEQDDGGIQPYSSTNICWAISSAIVSSIVTGCTDACISSICTEGENCSYTKDPNCIWP